MPAQHDAHPSAPVEPTSEPAPEHIEIGRLPGAGKYLFGRDQELARLDSCWSNPGTRIVSIIAMGGAGKSSLVGTWLKRMQRDGWRGAERVFGWSFYSQGSSNTASGDTFIAEALRWFGHTDPIPVGAWERGALLARLVKEQRTLLVLDGLEPLQAPPGVGEGKIRDHGVAALVRELAAAGRGLCVITSRFAVDDLASPEDGPTATIDLEKLSSDDGAKLLKVLGAKGTTAELEEAAREVKGHALALTLLGSYLNDACAGDIRRRKEIGPLQNDMKGGEHAKRVMAAYARWFGEGPEVSVLRLLGLFDRPADEGCIRALRQAPAISKLTEALVGMDDLRWNQTLAKLRRAHLVAEASSGEPGALDAHPLVREHFGARLREEAPEAWREGHGRLFEHLQKVAPPFPEDTVAMAPLYAAVLHGCHAGRRHEALDEVLLKRVYRGEEGFSWTKLGALGAELGMFAAFFDPPWTRLAPGLTETDEAFVLSNAGFALCALGRLDEAAEPMRLGLERYLAQERWESAAIAASNLSELHLARGAMRDAVVSARRSVELADRSEDLLERTNTRTTLADTLHQAGSVDEARALFEEAEALQKKEHPQYPMLYSLRGFLYCDLLLALGQLENVLDRAQSALMVADQNCWLLDIALDHLSLGRAHLLLALRDRTGDVASARAEFDKAITGLLQAGYLDYLPRGLLARAELHLATSDLPAAEHDLDEALSIATRSGMRLFEADAKLGFARLHLARGDHDAARASFTAAKALVDSTGYHRRDKELASLEAEIRAMPRTALPDAPLNVPRDKQSPGDSLAKSATTEAAIAPPVAPIAQNASALSPSPAAAPSLDPTMTNPPSASQRPLDIGIVVALPEELRELLDLVGDYTPRHEDDLDAYHFERGSYRCAVTLVGDMGESQAVRVTERLIPLWNPGSIIVIGIAAGVHDDLRVGDVYVPPQAVQYMQDAKAAPGDSGEYVIKPGAPAYRADYTLLAAVRRFEFTFRDAHQHWRADSQADLTALVPDASMRDRLVADKLVRRDVGLLADGHVATGPVVGAAASFSAWIRTHDRNVKALEMESAAVLLAAQTRSAPKRALAIRGISDYGNDRKRALDQIGEGVLRRYAMRNAVRLLFALLEAGALPRESAQQNPR